MAWVRFRNISIFNYRFSAHFVNSHIRIFSDCGFLASKVQSRIWWCVFWFNAPLSMFDWTCCALDYVYKLSVHAYRCIINDCCCQDYTQNCFYCTIESVGDTYFEQWLFGCDIKNVILWQPYINKWSPGICCNYISYLAFRGSENENIFIWFWSTCQKRPPCPYISKFF